MIIILFGLPLTFWFGIITLIDFSLQIFLGIGIVRGHPGYFKYHKANAVVLCFLVFIHLVLGLMLYL